MNNLDLLIADLSLFADLGTDPPEIRTSGTNIVVRMMRDGDEVELVFGDNGAGKIRAQFGDESVTFSSYNALLASDRFGDLRRWADVQSDTLRRRIGSVEDAIAPLGRVSDASIMRSVEEVSELLARKNHDGSRVLLVDGPAGIGKTHLIELIALIRANQYKQKRAPLLLHVQSRGKILTNIQDLMAFALQSLRLGITYDQVPVFVRQGLVVLAIDGFDELGDPSGYELAWAQVNDLISQVRGGGVLLLSGRETFIGRERLVKQLSLKSVDEVESITLEPPTPSSARAWLTTRGWRNDDLGREPFVSLFEHGSYALRPFFLRLLADHEVLKSVESSEISYFLAFLVDHMIQREATKFGKAVESVLTKSQREAFIRSFLREVARDLADSQAESIDESSLAWLVEASLEHSVPSDLLRILKNRAAVMAFLVNDDKIRHRRFAHTELANFFLSEVIVSSIANGDIPKCIRRNILGSDFISGFGDVISNIQKSDGALAERFMRSLQEALVGYFNLDRGARNMASLALACLPVQGDVGLALQEAQIDEAVVKGTAANAILRQVTISQLDARGANLEAIGWEESHVVTLIGDDGFKPSASFPVPSVVQYYRSQLPEVLTDAKAIVAWLARRRGEFDGELDLLSGRRSHPLFQLLGKALRFRDYWIRSEGDQWAQRIVGDAEWVTLIRLLDEFGLLRAEEQKAASGKAATFYHIRRSEDILREDLTDPDIRGFYERLARAIDDSND